MFQVVQMLSQLFSQIKIKSSEELPYSFQSDLPPSSGGPPRTSGCGNSSLGGHESKSKQDTRIE